VAYGAAITLLLALFWPAQPQAVVAGVLVMALGDGFAGLLGPLISSPSWQILGQRKSVLGTGTMAGMALMVVVLLRQLGGSGPGPAALVLISLAATLLEQIAIFGLDNLSVPVATGLLWSWLSLRP
jgi:phytol kinase